MKLGMPTLIEFKALEQNVDFCVENNLHFIELNMNLPIYTPQYLDHMKLRKIKKEYGIDFSIHLPEEIDLASFHPSIRKGHLQLCKETINWANRAEIKTLNMHLNNGIYFTLPQERVWVNEQYESELNESLYESFNELLQLSKSVGVELCIENTANFNVPFISRALEVLLAFKDFNLTWDVGHDALTNFNEEPFFNRFADRIKHMHLHDYNGKSDHQPLYSGIVPINKRLQFAQDHDISIVIEVKTSEALKESVKQISNNFDRG